MSSANVAGVDVGTRHWIGGRQVGSPGTFTDISPIDEQPIARLARGDQATVADAVSAAREAFAGWAATPPGDRARLPHALADRIDERAEDLARVERRSAVPGFSGIGREGGTWSFDFYSDVKNTVYARRDGAAMVSGMAERDG